MCIRDRVRREGLAAVSIGVASSQYRFDTTIDFESEAQDDSRASMAAVHRATLLEDEGMEHLK